MTGGVGLQLVFGVVGALLLNQRFRLRGVVRGLAMIPWATPSVLVALIWMWLLDPNHGLVNAVLMRTGLIHSPVAWFGNPHSALPTLIVVDAWQGIPFFAVMVLAALQAVPEELKESARTDGCGFLRVFWFITVPSILPTVLITLVLRLIWTANYIDLAYVLTGARGRLSAGFLLGLMVLSLLLILDIDQPTLGAVRESQGPMEAVQRSMAVQPPAIFDRWRTPAAAP